MKEDNIQHAWQ